MEESEDKLGKLNRIVEAAKGRFKGPDQSLLGYVDRVVVPSLKEALDSLSLEIDQRHRLNEDELGKKLDVIHYTSIFALMSILQSAANGQETSLRLYDSAHFNDPDEGNYLGRYLPTGQDWLSDVTLSHAYVTSFIVPDSNDNRDLSDNLVFWRTYGNEGEGCSLKMQIPTSRLREVAYGPTNASCTWDVLLPALEAINPLVNLGQEIREKLANAFWGVS